MYVNPLCKVLNSIVHYRASPNRPIRNINFVNTFLIGQMKNALAWWSLITILCLVFATCSKRKLDSEHSGDEPGSKPRFHQLHHSESSDTLLTPIKQWERNEPARKKLQEFMRMHPLQTLTQYYREDCLYQNLDFQNIYHFKKLIGNYEMSPSDVEEIVKSLICYKRVHDFFSNESKEIASKLPIWIPLFEKLGYEMK